MRQLLTSLIVTVTFLGSTNASNPIIKFDAITIMENNHVVFTVSNKADEELFSKSSFSSLKETIYLQTNQRISFLQFINESGEIEYQLPIYSDKLNIDISDFTKGSYTLNLLVEGSNAYVSTVLYKLF